MTLVTVDLRGAGGPARASLTVRAVRRTTMPGYVLTRGGPPLVVTMPDGTGTLDLPASTYEVVETVRGLPPVVRVVLVPDVATVPYAELLDVDPLDDAG